MFTDVLFAESGIPREALLEKGDEENRTPLHWAVIKGDVNMVKLLIEQGSRVDAQTVIQPFVRRMKRGD